MLVSGTNNPLPSYTAANIGQVQRQAADTGTTSSHTPVTTGDRVSIPEAGMSLAAKAAPMKYPDDPPIISDSLDKRSPYYGKYSEKEIFDAQSKLNQQEFMAFGHLAGDASTQGIIKLSEAYLKYINGLSPEAQQTGRYAGTKESVTNLLIQAKAKLATESTAPTKKANEPTSFIMMMLEAMSKNIEGQHTSTSKGATGNPS